GSRWLPAIRGRASISRSGRTCAADASIARVIQFFRLGTGGTRPAQRSASLQPLEPLPYFGAAEIHLSSDNSRMAILSRAHENSYQPLSPTIHTATWITREKSRLGLPSGSSSWRRTTAKDSPE